MPRISPSFIQRLIANVSIDRLIGSCVTLKKSGSNYACCCPFHHEKTPSFVVTPSKQMFYCFGCHEHGNAIDFLKKYKNLSFVEAVEDLARFAGLEVEYEQGSYNPEKADRYKKYYELMDRVAAFFTHTLNTPKGAQGMEYFVRARQLSVDTIQKARLGFAPNEWDALRAGVCRDESEYKILIELGLVKERDGRTYSMFRNRVMIPIFDRRGRVISFGGRTLGDDKPKYMNTSESLIYRKRQELFGLYEALRDNNNRPPRLVVVEGYMDVIAVRQAGCSYAVASLGTATTKEQLKTMFQYTKQVVCCYDGDAAGRAAGWHALQTVTPIMEDGTEIRFAFLPSTDDPDSLVRRSGLSAFTQVLDNSKSYAEFLVEHLLNDYNLNDPGQLSAYVSAVLKEAAKIPLKPVQAVVLKQLSGKAGMDETMLYDMLKDTEKKPDHSGYFADVDVKDETAGTAAPANILNTPMRRLIAFTLQQPLIVEMMYEKFRLPEMLELCRALKVRGCDELSQAWGRIREDPTVTPAVFIEMARDTPSENAFRALLDADLQLSDGMGGEVSIPAKISLFGTLLSEVLSEPLRSRAAFLSRLGSPQENSQAEFMHLQGNLHRRGLQKPRR